MSRAAIQICDAIEAEDIQFLRDVLPVASLDTSESTVALDTALKIRSADAASALFESGVQASLAKSMRVSSLINASQTSLLELLLQNGLSIDALPQHDITQAVVQNKIELVEVLLQHGLDPCTDYGYLVAEATYRHHDALLELLLDHGGDAALSNAKQILSENLYPDSVHYLENRYQAWLAGRLAKTIIAGEPDSSDEHLTPRGDLGL